MPATAVGVVGMKALRRDINRMSSDVSGPLYRAIKAAGKAAAEPVAARARASLPADERAPSRWNAPGRLAGSVRTSGTRTGAAVRMGRATVPYAGWIEFGGSRPDGSQREFIPSGRYLWPAAQGLANEAAALYSQAIGQILNSPSVWTNTTDEGAAVHD